MRLCLLSLLLLLQNISGLQIGFAQSNEHTLRQLPVGESTTDREAILSFMAELEKDIMRWRNGIEFVGEFVQRETGYGLSPEEAKAAVDISSETARADMSKVAMTGRFAKLRLALRYQQLAKQNLRYEHQPGGATVSGQFSVDLSAANGMEFKYNPKQTANDGVDDINVGDTIYFGKFDYLPDEQVTTETLHRFPFELMGGNYGYPFILPTESIQLEFENTDGGFHITMVNSETEDGVVSVIMRMIFEFSDSDKGPYLTKRIYNSGESRTTTELTEFADCGNGFMFPKGMILIETDPEMKSRGISWHSENVGKREPESSDFDVVVAAGTKWHGFDPNGKGNRWKSTNEEVYTLNILKLDPKVVESNYGTSRRDRRKR